MEMVKEAHALVFGAFAEKMGTKWEVKVPASVIITAYYKNRLIDCDNVPAKLWIDGLKQHVFPDDSPKYISEVTTRSRKGKTNYVEIEIT